MTTTISDYIKHDLRGRIDSGLDIPADLTLMALARHYGVSLTPVREALRELVAEGVLLKGENRRIRVNPVPRPRSDVVGTERPDVEPPRRSDTLEEALAAEVIAKGLRGESDYLREEATADRFHVGRTAIRQALSRLAGRGLIVHVPRCGWRVRAFDEADLHAYLEIREVLELKALDLARPHLDESELRRMFAGNVPGGDPPRLNNDLHAYLIAKAGNAYIRDFFDRQGAYYTTLFDFAAPETRHVAEMARQHRVILQALIAKNWTMARRALSSHIRAQRPIVKQLMSRIGRVESSPP